MKISSKLFLAALACLPLNVWADSPLTSTTFYEAYEKDCAPNFCRLLTEAKQSHQLTSEMSGFLADDSQSLAQRAALVNAIGWDTNGKYMAPRFKKFLSANGFRDPSAEQAFLLGYMTALDKYLDNSEAGLPLIYKATRQLPESGTITLIRALVEAQVLMNQKPVAIFEGDNGYSAEEAWGKIWPVYEKALIRAEGMGDRLTPEAISIITSYMRLYASYAQ